MQFAMSQFDTQENEGVPEHVCNQEKQMTRSPRGEIVSPCFCFLPLKENKKLFSPKLALEVQEQQEQPRLTRDFALC